VKQPFTAQIKIQYGPPLMSVLWFENQSTKTFADMSFSTFFSKQAEKPSGLFGRYIMSTVFDIGNAYLNSLVCEQLSVQAGDYVLDMGCGTGKLIYNLAVLSNDGYFEGVDYSDPMVLRARRKNKKYVKFGKVKILKGDFDKLSYENNFFTKVSSVNTIYFWPKPEFTAQKVSNILKPGGIFIVAFEDIKQLKQRNLNRDIFNFYTAEDVKDLLSKSGFSTDINLVSKSKGKQTFHCVVAKNN
jgi:SAM-dependent methyltransferase